MPPPAHPVRAENLLLAFLPPADFERVAARMRDVSFAFEQVAFRANGPIDAVYFPRTGMLSAVTTMANGAAVEVGTVGREGFAGVPLALGVDRSPTQVFCQITPCDCRRMPADAFRDEVERPGPFRAAVLRYTQSYLNLVSQSAACNGTHTVEQRCARWLLMSHDRSGSDQFPLTQELLGMMLGVRRSSVSVAAGTIQRAGLIRYARGKITVLDRPGLEAAACECYQVIRAEHARLLSPYPGK